METFRLASAEDAYISEWPMTVGEIIKRSMLHDQFGGSRQSGIS